MYASKADLDKLIAPDLIDQLCDDGPGGQAPDDVIAEAIEQADREIDAYLGQISPVPLSPVPPIANMISAKIAIYNLHRRRPHLELGEWGEEYKRCVKLLEKIAKKEISIGTPDDGGGQSQAADPARMAVVTPSPYFDLSDF
ncbi:DUF1320 domain-containing protein [Dethiosulfatarculus sandiegensis]|uniref:DUF1320 domain-containing protein n=1 Tax=Dethiosulfatarculus sandiegensis TaxID=1429043 RepID=UPI0005CB443C|nr:DUF1320 domain-containing protein [Dethiosulfatarculus sandiegensis]